MKTATHSIIVRRLIKAPRARVFDAFSRADALAQWFTPAPDISVEILAFDFTAAGGFRLRYTMPDGQRPIVAGTYELIAPPGRLAFSWVWQAPDPHADVPTRVRIEFLEKGDSTELVITHDRLPSREACTRHAAGWEGTLDNLARSLATKECLARVRPRSSPQEAAQPQERRP